MPPGLSDGWPISARPTSHHLETGIIASLRLDPLSDYFCINLHVIASFKINLSPCVLEITCTQHGRLNASHISRAKSPQKPSKPRGECHSCQFFVQSVGWLNVVQKLFGNVSVICTLWKELTHRWFLMTHLAPDGLQLGFVAEQLVDKAAGEAHTEYQL